MKQRTDTKNEVKNWYQKWSKTIQDQFIEINNKHFDGIQIIFILGAPILVSPTVGSAYI